MLPDEPTEDEIKQFEGLSRLQLSILFVLYKYDPIPMTEKQIENAIYFEGLLSMTEDEFWNYGAKLIKEKQFREKARLN